MARQFNLSHNTTYKVIKSLYISLENGGGWPCENCGKIITTMVTVENLEGKQNTVGADCAKTLAGIGKIDLCNINQTVSKHKKFYKVLEQNKNAYITTSQDNKDYTIFNLVTKDFMGKLLDKPFISMKFVYIEKEALASSFITRILAKQDLLNQYPILINDYHIKNNLIN